MDKRTIIMDHYNNPRNMKKISDKNYLNENTSNASCIDNLDIYIKIENDVIMDMAFSGEACAISVSSASIMTCNLIGKTINEALEFLNNMEAMLNNQTFNKDILNEAVVYEDTKHTSRKTCAWLPYAGLKKILNNINVSNN